MPTDITKAARKTLGKREDEEEAVEETDAREKMGHNMGTGACGSSHYCSALKDILT